MSLKEKLNQNPKMAAGVVGGLAALAIAIIAFTMLGGNKPGAGAAGAQVFYSNDDGATYFADADFPTRIPPFTKDGKQAFRAYVYTCDGGKTKFVGALMRYSQVALAKLQQAANTNKFDDPLIFRITEGGEGSEWKVPKTPETATSWVKQTDPKANAIMNPKCPPGTAAGSRLDTVVPE